MPFGKDEIRNRWGYHPPVDSIAVKRHDQVREAYIAFAEFLDMILPDGRAKSKAFNNLQQSSMWANFSIAELSPVVDSEQPKDIVVAPEVEPVVDLEQPKEIVVAPEVEPYEESSHS